MFISCFCYPKIKNLLLFFLYTTFGSALENTDQDMFCIFMFSFSLLDNMFIILLSKAFDCFYYIAFKYYLLHQLYYYMTKDTLHFSNVLDNFF